jgi:Spy/CpxP family protein refolding chaperone
MGGGAFLLQNAQVQKELKLTEEQIAKIKEINEAVRPPSGADRPNFQEMTAEQRQEFFAEMRKKGEEAAKKASEALNADQNARFKQIQLQMQIRMQGNSTLAQNEELAKSLKLTDDQKSALKTIADESGKRMGDLFRSMGPQASEDDRTKAREEMATLRTETDAECLAVLTDEQKAQLEKLQGPKFELDMSAFGRGGPGGPGGRRGRPGNNN